MTNTLVGTRLVSGSRTSESVPGEVLRAASDLRVAATRIVRRLRQQCEKGELTASELSVLARVEEHGPCGPAALAESEQVSPPVVCAMLASLLQQGLVRRDPDPHDRRRAVMSLTPAGRSKLNARRSALSQQVAGALTNRFTAAERAQLLAVVPLLKRLAAEL